MSSLPVASAPTASAMRPRPATHPYARGHAALGDPAPLACTLAKAVLEAVSGAGDLTTLVRWIEPDLRARLERQRSLARRKGLPPCTARVLRARVSRPSAGAAEVSIVVDDGTRSRAIAMRFEDTHGRWLATVIDVL